MTLFVLLACSEGSLEVTPNPVAFGEVDFHAGSNCEPEDGGCAPLEVRLRNSGDADLELVSTDGYDGDYLCIEGHASDTTLDLGSLPPGASAILAMSICGYQPGELTSEVSGSVEFGVPGGTESIDWSFTPIRDQDGEDTGG